MFNWGIISCGILIRAESAIPIAISEGIYIYVGSSKKKKWIINSKERAKFLILVNILSLYPFIEIILLFKSNIFLFNLLFNSSSKLFTVISVLSSL